MVEFIIGNVTTKVVTGEWRIQKLIYDALHYEETGYGKRGRWKRSESYYNPNEGFFLTGFLLRVLKHLRTQNVQYRLTDSRKRPEIKERIIELHGIELREYQTKAVLDFFKEGRGIAHLATGAGKTEIAIAATWYADAPTLFLTHRVELLRQTRNRFKKRLPRKKIGMIGDGVFAPEQITLATVQTVDSILTRYNKLMQGRKTYTDEKLDRVIELLHEKKNAKKITGKEGDKLAELEGLLLLFKSEDEIRQKYAAIKQLLGSIRLLIIDEAHRSGNRQFYQAANMCSNAYWRLALTATPFMHESVKDNLMLEGITGRIVSRVSIKTLIELGVLAQPYFRFYPVRDPKGMRSTTGWPNIYERGIIQNAARNALIVKSAKQLVKMGRKTLIIVAKKVHGRLLAESLQLEGVKAEYVDGDVNSDQREKALKSIASGKLECIVCTNIFDEGIDVESIGGVILAAGNKSAPALFQRAGRAMRKKEENNYCIVIDFIDNQHPKLLEHSMRRYKLVEQEEGFKILR